MEIIAQAISIVGMLVSIFALQFKTNRSLFICRGISGLLFALSYVLLGTYTAAAINLLNLLRSVFAINKKTRGNIFAAVVIAAYTAATVLTFNEYLSIMILLANSVETIVMWSRNSGHIRICQISFVSPIWLYHNIVTFSIGGILAEIFVIASAVVSFFRFRKTGFDKN